MARNYALVPMAYFTSAQRCIVSLLHVPLYHITFFPNLLHGPNTAMMNQLEKV